MNLSMGSFFRRAFGSVKPASRAKSRPTAPNGWCLYAIGDIHGEIRCLERMLAAIDQDQSLDAGTGRPLLLFLGDVIDRGPDSRGVLDRLCRLKAEAANGCGYACHFLSGNHEAAMLDFIADPVAGAEWLSFGGAETLASYGIRASTGIFDPARCRSLRDSLDERLPAAHRAFLQSLEPMVTLGDYLFVHAGVRPGVSLDRQKQEDLLWIREPFLSSSRFHGKVVVHGHTPVVEPQILDNRIGVDTGAYATGILSAVRLCEQDCRVLTVSGEHGSLTTACRTIP